MANLFSANVGRSQTTDLVVEVVVPVDPVLQGQVAEDVGGLGDEDLADRIAERFRNLLLALPAVLVGHRLRPDVGGRRQHGRLLGQEGLLLEDEADRRADHFERNHVDESLGFLEQLEITKIRNRSF